MDTVQHRCEAVGHGSELGHDLGEAVQGAPAAQRPGVVGDRLEAGHVLAFGVPLQRQEPEMDLEQREVPRRCLDHEDRKSTRLNSSHSQISYAVFCLKKKKKK